MAVLKSLKRKKGKEDEQTLTELSSPHRRSQAKRVSMGLTVRRKTAKNLTVRRKNERILAVSRKKN